MDMKRHLKSALKQLGFDKPRKAQIIPMNTLDAEQDAIVIAATGSGKQVIYETEMCIRDRSRAEQSK